MHATFSHGWRETHTATSGFRTWQAGTEPRSDLFEVRTVEDTFPLSRELHRLAHHADLVSSSLERVGRVAEPFREPGQFILEAC